MGVSIVQRSDNTCRFGHNPQQRYRPSVFAVAFDMDTSVLQASYHNPSWQNACTDIGRVLGQHGLARQQGGVYFGNDTADAVRCVLAVQDL